MVEAFAEATVAGALGLTWQTRSESAREHSRLVQIHAGDLHLYEGDLAPTAVNSPSVQCRSELEVASWYKQRSDKPASYISIQKEVHVDTDRRSSKHAAQSKRGHLCRIGLVGLVMFAIAISVGLGVGLHERQNSARNEAVSSQAPASTPVQSLNHGITNDSTLVAWLDPNSKTRHVFFQDVDQSIRQAVFDPSTRSWTGRIANVVATDARAQTPMSVAERTYLPDGSLSLFYIRIDHTVAFATFTNSSWITSGPVFNNSEERIPVSTKARGLSAGVTTGRFMSLAYEDPDGSLRIVKLATDNSNTTSLILSEDITPNLQDASNGARFQAPFSSEWGVFDQPNFFFVLGLVSGSGAAQTTMLQPVEYNATSDVFMLTNVTNPRAQMVSQNQTDVALIFSHRKDIAMLWRDSQSNSLEYAGLLVETNLSLMNLHSPFPFGRIARFPCNNQEFIYHQINESMFAQDVWDINRAQWVSSTNVSVDVV